MDGSITICIGFSSRGLLSNIFRQISFRTLFFGYSRFHERQADDTALDIMLNSRLNPYKMIQLFSDFEHLDTVHYNFFQRTLHPHKEKLRILKQLVKIKEYSHQDTNVLDEGKTTDNLTKNTDTPPKEPTTNQQKNPPISPSLPESTNTDHVNNTMVHSKKHQRKLPDNVIPFPKYRHKSKK